MTPVWAVNLKHLLCVLFFDQRDVHFTPSVEAVLLTCSVPLPPQISGSIAKACMFNQSGFYWKHFLCINIRELLMGVLCVCVRASVAIKGKGCSGLNHNDLQLKIH